MNHLLQGWFKMICISYLIITSKQNDKMTKSRRKDEMRWDEFGKKKESTNPGETISWALKWASSEWGFLTHCHHSELANASMQQSEKQNGEHSRLHNRTSLCLVSLLLWIHDWPRFVPLVPSRFWWLGHLLMIYFRLAIFFKKISRYNKHFPFLSYLVWNLMKVGHHMKVAYKEKIIALAPSYFVSGVIIPRHESSTLP